MSSRTTFTAKMRPQFEVLHIAIALHSRIKIHKFEIKLSCPMHHADLKA